MLGFSLILWSCLLARLRIRLLFQFHSDAFVQLCRNIFVFLIFFLSTNKACSILFYRLPPVGHFASHEIMLVWDLNKLSLAIEWMRKRWKSFAFRRKKVTKPATKSMCTYVRFFFIIYWAYLLKINLSYRWLEYVGRLVLW